jgi:glycosyltransferase involved in cell wall biosynthesis
MNRRILYMQYTNPAGYPPLEHSSRILADAGWDVLFLGTSAHGVETLDFPPHPNIKVRRWKFQEPGFWQKLHFLAFYSWVIVTAIWWRPKWIYASDMLVCPIALALKRLGFRVLYHEHDSPNPEVRNQMSVGSRVSPFRRLLMWTRKRLARRADVCVLPNEQRVEMFKEQTGREGPTFCVWNCPRREEALTPNQSAGQMTLYYHGNISAELLPEVLLEALLQVPEMRMLAIGYATAGNEDYPGRFRDRTAKLGMTNRVELLDALPRSELLNRARQCSIGWACVPRESNNFNFLTMVGASNKAFDYLACGLQLLVSDLPDWNAMFLPFALARACDPCDADSIAAALRLFIEYPQESKAMGERGRQCVLEHWNYQKQFECVLRELEKS